MTTNVCEIFNGQPSTNFIAAIIHFPYIKELKLIENGIFSSYSALS
ncbi:hypothetical protein C900_05069 [Fulvivirga imtechensis AK7]|uniref:Uncharacterized protein n=1 Tax=Fulvivirga imtechensis AK7 TaxID=1237149 RepID=L8JPE3_9BACT|nr:hypothetical protein C900_05069 [Fulvivirga imtechensis AK7]